MKKKYLAGVIFIIPFIMVNLVCSDTEFYDEDDNSSALNLSWLKDKAKGLYNSFSQQSVPSDRQTELENAFTNLCIEIDFLEQNGSEKKEVIDKYRNFASILYNNKSVSNIKQLQVDLHDVNEKLIKQKCSFENSEASNSSEVQTDYATVAKSETFASSEAVDPVKDHKEGETPANSEVEADSTAIEKSEASIASEVKSDVIVIENSKAPTSSEIETDSIAIEKNEVPTNNKVNSPIKKARSFVFDMASKVWAHGYGKVTVVVTASLALSFVIHKMFKMLTKRFQVTK